MLEVEHLIKALKAADKKFDYKIYDKPPGGHEFNRIDTRLAKDSSPGPAVTTIVKPPAARLRATSANRTGSHRFVAMTEPG